MCWKLFFGIWCIVNASINHSQNMQITGIAILSQFHSYFQRPLCSTEWRYIHLKFVNTLLFESVFNSLHLPVHRCEIGMPCVVQFPTAAFYCVSQAVTSQGWTNSTLLSLTREWSDPTCRNQPWFFFFTARVHTTKSTVKILAANTHCNGVFHKFRPSLCVSPYRLHATAR
jgi:hypothetical protein